MTLEFLQQRQLEQSAELGALKRPAATSESAASLAYAMNAQAIGDPLTAEEWKLLRQGEKMGRAATEALSEGRANVMSNLELKEFLPAVRVAASREVRTTLISAVNDMVMRKENPFAMDLADALSPLNVTLRRDRLLAKETIKVAMGSIAKAGNCDEYARAAATTDVGDLTTLLAGGKTPFPHQWAEVEDATGNRMKVDAWSSGAPVIAPRHARHAVGLDDGKPILTLSPSERDTVRAAAERVADLVSETGALQSKFQEEQDKAKKKLKEIPDICAALGGFATAPSTFSDKFLTDARTALPKERPLLSELHAAQALRSQGLGLSASRRGEITAQIVAQRATQVGLPVGAAAKAESGS